MDTGMRRALVRQLGASVAMLRDALDKCPDDLWDNRDEGSPYWQIGYHALYFFDLYLCESEAAFRPAEFHRDPAQSMAGDYSWLNPPITVDHPTFALEKTAMLAYLDACWERCQRTVETLSDDRATSPCGFPWYNMPFEELLLINLRHVQHHTGQLAQTLRRRAGMGVEWVGGDEVV